MSDSSDFSRDRAQISKISPTQPSEAERSSRWGTAVEWDASLERVFPGFTSLDRNLQLGGSHLVNMAGRDGAGRILLVLCVDGSDDAVALRALDTLAWANTHQDLLVAHLGMVDSIPEPFREDGPMIVLVSDSFAASLKDRLSPLMPRSVCLLERCSVESDRRSGIYLQPIGGGEAQRCEPEEQSLADFLEGFPDTDSSLILELALRLERMDDEVCCEVDDDRITWSYRGASLCSVFAEEGSFVGTVSPERTTHALERPEQLEAFVDGVLRAYLVAFERAGADDPSLPQVELRPTGPRPHLSAEELEAFR